MGSASVGKVKQYVLLYGLCICTGRELVLVIVCVVHQYWKITSVSYFTGCESVCKKTRFSDCMVCASVREENQC